MDRTAVHEIGHALTGVILGRRVKAVTCDPGEGFRGMCIFERDPHLTDGQGIFSTAGGIAAEFYIFGDYACKPHEPTTRPPTQGRTILDGYMREANAILASSGATIQSDWEYLEEQAQQAGAKPGRETTKLISVWLHEAYQIIKRHDTAFRRLVDELTECGSLAGDEVRAIINEVTE